MMLQGMIFFLAIPLMVGNDFSWTTIGDNVILMDIYFVDQ